jgi:hypothetical protein
LYNLADEIETFQYGFHYQLFYFKVLGLSVGFLGEVVGVVVVVVVVGVGALVSVSWVNTFDPIQKFRNLDVDTRIFRLCTT